MASTSLQNPRPPAAATRQVRQNDMHAMHQSSPSFSCNTPNHVSERQHHVAKGYPSTPSALVINASSSSLRNSRPPSMKSTQMKRQASPTFTPSSIDIDHHTIVHRYRSSHCRPSVSMSIIIDIDVYHHRRCRMLALFN
eukprot:3634722-Rhodomonas_salina.3